MTSLAIYLPEDTLNYIFEYFSHITDSGCFLKIDRKGKLRLVARDIFMVGINHINFQKRHSTWFAGPIKLLADKGGANWDLQPVDAISQPMLSSYKNVMYANYAEGFFYRNMCLQYDDPETGSPMVAYIDLRVNYDHGEDEIVFHQGCVYDEQGNSFVITGYGSDAFMTRIQINPFNMIWDTVGDDANMWDDDDVFYEEDDDDVFGDNYDPDAQPLNMYM